MLEGSVPEFATPLISQPSPQPASSAPSHNGFALTVRGVRFCGNGMRVAPPQKASPSAARTVTHQTVRTPAFKPAPQRRKSAGVGKGNTLAMTPIPTPLPPDVTSRLKASLGQDRPRFCDRLNAMFKSGVNTIECDDDKDPYAFVESSSVTEIHQLQRPLQQAIRNNGIVNTNGHSRKSPAANALSVVNPKKRKTNNIADSKIPNVIQPGKSLIVTPPNSTSAAIMAKQKQNLVQVQQQQQQQRQQLLMKQSFDKLQKISNNITRPQNMLKQSVTRQEITSTSSMSASNSHATSILRPVKFAELVNNRRSSGDDHHQQVKKVINNVTSKSNPMNKIPATLPTSNLAPPLAPLKSVISEDEKTTMNQLQAKIARNRVIGKHHRNNKVLNTSSHSQSIIANPSNKISSQQLLKLKERSLLEEQLLSGIKQEKSTSSSFMKQPQQMKTVTKHFTYPTKSAGSVVTYKKMVAPSPSLQAIANTSSVSFKDSGPKASKKKALGKQEIDQHKAQMQELVNIWKKDQEYRKNLFDYGFGEDTLSEKYVSPFQHHWHFEDTTSLKISTVDSRETRINNLKATFRRRYMQLQRAVQSHSTCDGDSVKKSSRAVLALVNAARTQPNRTAALLETADTTEGSSSAIKLRHKPRRRHVTVPQSICCMDDCGRKTLPMTRHCPDHIMNNIDQLLFTHCTAKFSDNTQCSNAVFDIRHNLPLCQEHVKKRDNYVKMSTESKKARKRAKPAAMTKPNKRGKKRRRNNSAVAVAEPNLIKHEPMVMPSPVHSTIIHSPPDIVEAQGVVPMYMATEDSLSQPPHHTSFSEHQVSNWRRVPGSDSDSDMAGLLRQVEAQAMSGSGLGLVEEEDLPLEGAEEELATLPLEGAEDLAHQATMMLEEHDDLASVLSQIPPDTLNELFNACAGVPTGEKTGIYEPTREETEELERALAAVDKDVRSLEKMQKMGGSTASVLPAELVESILGGHLGVHLDDASVSTLGAGLAQPLSRHHGMVKEEVVIDGCSQLMNNSSHLMSIHDTSYQIHQGADMQHLLSGGPDSMIQLDAAVFPPDAMLLPNLGHSTQQTVGSNFLLPQQTHQFQTSDILLHQNLLHQSLGDPQQQLMLTPATSVFGGGAAPPPTPNSAHQPAVANTPPFHHQNGFLSDLGGQFDAKFGLQSPGLSTQFSPLTSSMGTQTQHADS